MVHSKSEWKSYEKGEKVELSPVTLKVGEKKLAYKNRVGFPPMFGGYIPSLKADDTTVVKSEMESVSNGTDTYLTGLKEGVTKVYLINGLVYDDPSAIYQNSSTLTFDVKVVK